MDIKKIFKNHPSNATFLTAVSGGADSMALLAALHEFSISTQKLKNQSPKIICFHVEHGLRPSEESKGDAEFVRDYCKKNGIEFEVVFIPPGKIAAFAKQKGIGIEAAARYFRHKALRSKAKTLGKNTRILTGHTKDDSLETALMRVLRGCGQAGLAVMPESRGRFLRPLLGLTRKEIVEYLNDKNIAWREDITNNDEIFLRNKIRLRLVPLLDEVFPSWKTGVAVMAQTQSYVTDFITEEAKIRIKWKNNQLGVLGDLSERKKTANHFSTDTENFFAQSQIIREEALFQAIDELLKGKENLKSVKRTVVRKFCAGLVNAADLGVVKVRREGEKVTVSLVKKEYFERGVSRLL